MKSKLTGGEASLIREKDSLEYRGETFEYIHESILDHETQIRYTTTELDGENMERVYVQYRAKHGIPSPKELTQTRELYGLSAAKMSEILGLGTNQYRLYEEGVMPSEAIGKMLQSIRTPAVFLGYVENSKNQMPPEEYDKLCQKIQKNLLHDLKERKNITWFREFFSMGGLIGKVAL